MKLPIAILILSTALFACNSTPYTEEIEEARSLIESLDSASTELAQIDTSGYRNASKAYAVKVGYIQNQYANAGDTIDRELAEILTGYKELKKPYQQFVSKYETTQKEIEFSRKQLKNLKYDMEKASLDTQMVAEFMQTERDAVQKVITSVEQLKNSKSVTKVKAAIWEPKIDSVITVLKAKK